MGRPDTILGKFEALASHLSQPLKTAMDELQNIHWPRKTALVAVIGLLVGLVALRRRYLTPISHVPGPFWASITRLWHVSKIIGGKQNYTLLELHEKHGHFVRVAHNEVSVCHPDAVKALYLAPTRKGKWYRIFVFPDWRYPAAISILDPREKAEFMKYMSNAGFLLHNVLQYEGTIDENIAKLKRWMDRHAVEGRQMDLDKFFTYMAFDITGEITFSKPFGFLDEGKDVGGAIATNVALQIFLCTFGFYRWASWALCNPLVTWTQLAPVGHIVNTSMRAIAERQKNPDAKFDMCSHWFRGIQKAKKEGFGNFDERHLLSAAVSNLGAGSDTVSCGLQTFVYQSLRKPAVWQRVRDEIDAARKQGRCEGEVVSWEDVQQLPYLDAACKEALRLLAPVSIGKDGVTIAGQHFPEGTQMSINPGVIQLSKEIWGPDAQEFVPERWFSPDIERQSKCFMPWGLGWGSCPGQNLAKVQIYKTIATIVRDYDIKLVDPSKEWKWAAYFTLNPRDWPVYVTQRKY
ncbi:cytochrome P450 [Microdochium trichocladiopsis]|uniref:Cytochrome P450 n=1 Tax=Microdochium trichocladiopsis TaxID=1682393 RepID=A0A9P8YGC5_9PEZI|nr:cytochrome P450 [Microdochium trichocladiopsis]KAH7040011.1 cytochrome P450 [Microdochium trichocladiopsis]